MIEHEKKFKLRYKNVKKFQQLVIAKGFVHKKDTYQKDTYFSRADVDFMETKECLRIRVESDGMEVTYKPPTTKKMSSAKSIWKKEVNITIQDENTARELLLSLGAIELCTVEKRRNEFTKDNLTISIDHITDLGNFIEIEIIAHREDSSLIEKIEKVASDLGLLNSDIVTLPYRDLLINNL